MTFYVAFAVVAVGFGLYATAALLWDRRRHVATYLARSSTLGGRAAPVDPALIAAKHQTVYWSIIGSLVLGTILVLGSCVGFIAF